VESATYGALPRNVLGRLPAVLAGSRSLAGLVDFVDDGLGALLGPACQNRRLVARKPERATGVPAPTTAFTGEPVGS
ncbi:MAG: hypothetical protein ACHQ52_10305, partial [Candidatus Eisenbacteria bacterium]